MTTTITGALLGQAQPSRYEWRGLTIASTSPAKRHAKKNMVMACASLARRRGKAQAGVPPLA
jgi:hypothetical protein